MDGYIIFVSYHCDKIDHFISGFLLTTIGLCFYFYMDKSKEKNWKLGIWFALFFTMFIAVLFEFAEYFVYLTTDKDPQLNLTTGVVDTMDDLLVCFISSLVSLVTFSLYFSKGYKIFKYPIIDEFCEINHK